MLVVTTPPVPKVGSSTPPESRQRSSSASSRGRQRGVRGRWCAGPRGARFALGFRSQDENPMMLLLSETGLRSHDKAIAPGAQAERRGGAGPVRGLLGGSTSPTAFDSSGGIRHPARRRVGLFRARLLPRRGPGLNAGQRVRDVAPELLPPRPLGFGQPR